MRRFLRCGSYSAPVAVARCCFDERMRVIRKKYALRQRRRAALGDLRQVVGQLLFFDNEKTFLVSLNETEIVESLHEQADARPRRANHLGKFFMGDLELDTDTARIFLAHGARQLQ